MSTATKKKKNQIIGTNEEKERDNMVFLKTQLVGLISICCSAFVVVLSSSSH